MMAITPEWLALGILVLVGIFVILLVRSFRRNKIKDEYQLEQQGFRLLESAPGDLERRLSDLYDPAREREISAWRVYHHQEGDQDQYLFHVGDSRGDNSEIGTDVFGLISPHLALPRFALVTLPGFKQDSVLGGLMEKLLDRVMSFAEGRLQLQRIDLPQTTTQSGQLLAFGQDPEAVRRTLEKADLFSIQALGLPLQIAGSADLLILDFNSDSSFDPRTLDLAARYQIFVEICHRFRV